MKKFDHIKKFIEINGKKVGDDCPCYIVAEISCNHKQDLSLALSLIGAAAEAGADAVKFQTFLPEELTLPLKMEPFLLNSTKEMPEAWRTSLYELYEKAETPREWFPRLKQEAKRVGITMLSTPFGEDSVDFLVNEIGVPCIKIASYEALSVPLLRKVAKTGLPVIISEGFYPQEDVKFSIETLRKAGAKEIIVLHCVTQYATDPKPEDFNLNTMLDIKKRFGVLTGLSDNDAGIEVPFIAATMGAVVIEKHFMTKRGDGSLDDRFSLVPDEFKQMVKAIRRMELVKGSVHYGPVGLQSQEATKLCRSIFVGKHIKKGERLTVDNLRVIRPSDGLSPKNWDKVLGQIATTDIEEGVPLTWEMVKLSSGKRK